MEWYCNGEKELYLGRDKPEIIVAGILDGKKFNTKADTHGMFVAELPDLPLVVRIVWK